MAEHAQSDWQLKRFPKCSSLCCHSVDASNAFNFQASSFESAISALRPEQKRRNTKLRMGAASNDVMSHTYFFLCSFEGVNEREVMRCSHLAEWGNIPKQTTTAGSCRQLSAASLCLFFA